MVERPELPVELKQRCDEVEEEREVADKFENKIAGESKGKSQTQKDVANAKTFKRNRAIEEHQRKIRERELDYV